VSNSKTEIVVPEVGIVMEKIEKALSSAASVPGKKFWIELTP